MHVKSNITVLLLAVFLSSFGLRAAAVNEPPSLISETAVVMEAESGQILYQKDMDKGMYPASITKIMTVLLALENSSPDEKVTITNGVLSVPRDTTHISLTPGEQVTMEQLIYAAHLESANDACVAIAEHVSGSVSAFVDLMNRRAAEIGAQNTHFANPHGLYDETHITDARDMALITREALKNPDYYKVFTTLSYEMAANNKQKNKRYFATKLDFFKDTPYRFPEAIGGKNGWTTQSGHTLVTAAVKDGRTLISVVMKSTTPEERNADTLALLNYGFHSFRPVTLEAKTLVFTNFDPTSTSHVLSTRYQAGQDFTFLLHKNLPAGAVSITYDSKPGAGDQGPMVSARVALKNDTVSFMYPVIGTVPLTAMAQNPADAGQTVDNLLASPALALSHLWQAAVGWIKSGAWILGGILAFLVLLVIVLRLRRRIIINRRRKRKIMQQRRLMEIQRLQQLEQMRMKEQLEKLGRRR